jgi:hypothetical protein
VSFLLDKIESDLGENGPFFSGEGFDVPVTLADGSTIQAIFDNQYLELQSEATGTISTQVPMFHVADQAIDGLTLIDETVQIKGDNYIVRDIQPDGTGVSVVILELQ